MVFAIFKFWLSGLSGGWKGKKWPKMTKFFVCCTLCFRNHIWYGFHLWYTRKYKRIICNILRHFFHFFSKILVFGIIRGGGLLIKGQKMVQNGKKFCLSQSVSQEPYIIWLWLLVHMCKMMVSPANFLIFQNLDFWVF